MSQEWILENYAIQIPIQVQIDENSVEARTYDGGVVGELFQDIGLYISLVYPLLVNLLFFLPYFVLIFIIEYVLKVVFSVSPNDTFLAIVFGVGGLYYLEFALRHQNRIRPDLATKWNSFLQRYRLKADPITTKFSTEVQSPIRQTRRREYPISHLREVSLKDSGLKKIKLSTISGDQLYLGGVYGSFKSDTDIGGMYRAIEKLVPKKDQLKKLEKDETDRVIIDRTSSQGQMNLLTRMLLVLLHAIVLVAFLGIFLIMSLYEPFFQNLLPVASYLGRVPYIFWGLIMVADMIVFVFIAIRYTFSSN